MGWSVNRPTGLTFHRPNRSTKGYTLFTPSHEKSAYLIDMDGRVVHRWAFDTIDPGYGRLLDNGNLLMSGSDVNMPPQPEDEPTKPPPPFELHVTRLGGYKTTLHEVDPAGQEVRRIHLWELLDPVKDPINPTKRRWEWTHLNGIDVNDAGDIAFSTRTNDRVGVIDGATGELKLRFTDVVGQHHVTWVGDDLIQVFDNGRTMSRVLEIQVSTGEITWCYEANPAHQFFSNYMSGADRLWSGSVLVCEGSSGRLFEANRTGEVVWEWINPFVNYRPNGEVAVGLYRAHRYPENHPAFAGRDLDPLAHANLNRLNGLI